MIAISVLYSQEEWDALPLEDKITYDYIMPDDDGETGDIADVVESGNHNPVESDAVFDSEQEIYEVMGQNGAKNLAKPINSISYLGIDVVCDKNGVLTITGTASGSGGRLNIVSDSFTLKAGTYKVIHTSDDLTKYSSMVCHKKADNTSLGYSLINNGTIDNTHAQFTLSADTECFLE